MQKTKTKRKQKQKKNETERKAKEKMENYYYETKKHKIVHTIGAFIFLGIVKKLFNFLQMNGV